MLGPIGYVVSVFWQIGYRAVDFYEVYGQASLDSRQFDLNLVAATELTW